MATVEQRIVTLLKAAESGRIDRRQLLQALGVTAAGAVAVAALPASARAFAGFAGQQAPPAGSRKAFPVTTMNHLSYAVTDYVKTRDWYVDLFGMRIAWDNGTQCALEFGSMTSPEGIYIRKVGDGQKPSINHFAFGIPNIMQHIDAMKVEMERWGLKNIRPDGEHGWIADDPAGYMLNTWVPEKDAAMFPGAARPCKVASSPECKTAYEAGLKNLDKLPKPSGKGFTATAFSHVVLNVPAKMIPIEKEFYRDLMGMKVILDQPDAPKPQAFLRYGKNAQFIRPTPNATDEPYCNNYGFAIENFDRAKVEAELRRRGLNPKPYTDRAWTILDPDGMEIQVAGAGLPEYLAKSCQGWAEKCPQGS
jgi:catechol 2,3-dioxygenase-like lactoylglutathione lyase family enzyme